MRVLSDYVGRCDAVRRIGVLVCWQRGRCFVGYRSARKTQKCGCRCGGVRVG